MSSKNEFEMGQQVSASVVRQKGRADPGSDFKPKGFFTVEHLDKDGNIKGIYKMPNGVTNVGKDHVLNTQFNAGTPVNPWFIGIIDNSGFTALAAADTMASHAGWNEFTTYSEATRVDWAEDAASGQAISNSTPATFNITGSGTLNGVFLNSISTKSGTTGTLWATASFASTIPVVNTDQLKITYTVTAT
jgi:hypothetical protein